MEVCVEQQENFLYRFFRVVCASLFPLPMSAAKAANITSTADCPFSVLAGLNMATSKVFSDNHSS
jgi:hypothetical protein